MDTRFWGPSGWRLLHSITFTYNPVSDKVAVRKVFESLPFVLPCKYCRTSLSSYMKELPLEPALESKSKLSKWLWMIHNKVNDKLKDQGINTKQNPSFHQVEVFYNELLKRGCSRTDFPGWDFLFSIVDLHPSAKGLRSTPLSGSPDCNTLDTLIEKNEWNCLTSQERLPMYKQFWINIGHVFPFQEWRKSWSSNNTLSDEILENKSLLMKELWKIRCKMEADLELLNRCKYSQLCMTLRNYRSGCNRSTRGKTCRRKQQRDK